MGHRLNIVVNLGGHYWKMINCRIAQFIYVKNAPTTLTKNKGK